MAIRHLQVMVMGYTTKNGEWVRDPNKKTGCPQCGYLGFIRLRNKNGDILGDNVVCSNCKVPYALDQGAGEDGG